MKKLEVSAFDIAQRFVGTKEIPGLVSNPMILSMLRLDAEWPTGDEVAWCSAFVNFVAHLLRLPRSKSLLARSWLGVGLVLADVGHAEVGFDVIILRRGEGQQPGPENLTAPGHVGFYAGVGSGNVMLLGGNQGDGVNVSAFPLSRILGIRRLGG